MKGVFTMAAYTIEDIELIRRKSGISYQEAVSLLDYHNGNVARALVDLERNGRINPEAAQTQRPAASAGTASTSSSSGHAGKSGFVNLMTKLYRARLKISKDETPVVNVSALFSLLGLIIAPHLVIVGAIASLVLGYKFAFTKNDPEFAGENLERMVRNAADNVKASVGDIARGFQDGANGEPAASAAAESQPAAEQKSYYAARPTATASYRPDVPTLNVPVQVESSDGSVTVEGDNEGYTSATIE